MLGANDCGTIVMTMLDAICNAHENLAKVIEIMPKLLLSVCALDPSLTSSMSCLCLFHFRVSLYLNGYCHVSQYLNGYCHARCIRMATAMSPSI